MASCGDGGCGSHCSSKGEADDAQEGFGRLSLAPLSSSASGEAPPCSKCGGEDGRRDCGGLCVDCFRSYLFGKFKLAATSNAMIAPTDNLLVAFSGGPASRVALQFIHEMQSKAMKNWDASNSQALPVFDVGVGYVDESIFCPKSSHEIDMAIKDIQAIASSLAPAYKEIHIAPIEDICSFDSKDGRSRLNKLLDMITDTTGRDDFLNYLRMLSLQKIALENGYTKLVLGSCTSAIARRIISAMVKGQGYSLPADVQYVDTRWKVPVVFPLRDCLAQELTLLCHLDGLKMQQLLHRPCAGINSLVSSFVERLQEENPSREHTIVRTAGKLTPFCFNKLSASGYGDFLPSRLRPKFENRENTETVLFEPLCPTCGSPLTESEFKNLRSAQVMAHTKAEIFFSHCCQSCSFQTLPNESISAEHFFSLLPKSMTEGVMGNVCTKRSCLREEIQDYLLDNSDQEA